MSTSEPVSDQMADEEADRGRKSMQGVEAAIDMDAEGSRNVSPNRSAAVSSPESRIEDDFDFLWKLRKYLLLLAVLAVSTTYNAGLSPPGGFQMDNSLHHNAVAGDPLLPVTLFRRYEAFFYCNATAFAASLVLIILLLSRRVASKRVWLRSMQVTMVLDLFSLMGAYAAGSCRTTRSSVFILVLVCAAFVYVGFHIVIFIRVVPKWFKERVRKLLPLILEKLRGILNRMLSICHVPRIDGQNNSHNEIKEIEEARKFLLMLATFAATITYQAGMSPPGGFWGANGHGYHPGTFVLRRHNLLRFNIYTCCNTTSFVASLVTVILLLSKELSMHGIRTQALFVCVIADLLGLIGAYASGSCRDVATSLSVVLIVIVVLICVPILVIFLQSEPVTVWSNKAKPVVGKLLNRLSWPQKSRLSNEEQDDSQKTHQQDSELDSQQTPQQDAELDSRQTHDQDTELDSQGTHQQDTELESQRTHQEDTQRDSQQTHHQDTELDSQQTHHQDTYLDSQLTHHRYTILDSQGTHHQQDTEVKGGLSNLQCYSADGNLVSIRNVRSALASDLNSMDKIMRQSEQATIQTVCSSSSDALTTEEVHTYNTEVHSAGSQQLAIPIGPSSPCDSGNSIQGILPSPGSVDQNAASGDLSMDVDDPTREKSSVGRFTIPSSHGDSIQHHVQPMPGHHIVAENGGEITLEIQRADNGQATQHEERSSDCRYRNPKDVLLKKSRTYLLLLAIVAVSLTYQAGLNPPGGFWTSNATDHSAGDPILEDNYHKQYLAFFYLNATAFAASLVIIIMLLSRKMSNRVIKRRALHTAMITDLLALMGAFVFGSYREKTKTVYIPVALSVVVAYVYLHIFVSRHIIPGSWKECVAKRIKYRLPKSPRTDNESIDLNEKDLERRRSLLFILAILAATVTYQAGLNPPGGTWPDENSKDGKPGNSVLQDSHPKRYDIFYYSNAVSFVSSVAIIILLVNRESCERGIKSYALRACLVAGLLGLLIAYSAGSCRKLKSVIYLIVIAAAVLICLAIQVLVLSSTRGQLTCLRRWLRKILHVETDSEILLESSDEANKENNVPWSDPQINEKKENKKHKYLMLLAILAASIAYQAGLNPPGGFWPDDTPNGYKAGNPVLKDINSSRYMVFFVSNSISFMSSIAVVMLLLTKSVRKKKVPLQALHCIMILDLLALMTAFAAGSCRKFSTSIFVLVVVCCVVVYLLIVIIVSSGLARWLKKREGRRLPCWGYPSHVTPTNTLPTEHDV